MLELRQLILQLGPWNLSEQFFRDLRVCQDFGSQQRKDGPGITRLDRRDEGLKPYTLRPRRRIRSEGIWEFTRCGEGDVRFRGLVSEVA